MTGKVREAVPIDMDLRGPAWAWKSKTVSKVRARDLCLHISAKTSGGIGILSQESRGWKSMEEWLVTAKRRVCEQIHRQINPW